MIEQSKISFNTKFLLDNRLTNTEKIAMIVIKQLIVEGGSEFTNVLNVELAKYLGTHQNYAGRVVTALSQKGYLVVELKQGNYPYLRKIYLGNIKI